MSARTIETKAVISAEDRTGNAFSSVLRRLAKMETAAKQAGGSLGTIDRAQAASHRAGMAHERERVRVQREMNHHGIVRYSTQAAASAVAAHSIVHTITESLKGGAELQHSLVALRNSGRTVEEIAEIMSRAGDVMKSVPTSSLKDNLETILETTGAFGSMHHAMENLEFVQKITSVLKAAGDGQASSKSVAYDFAKFAEIRGSAGDTKRLRYEANEMTRGMVFTGGKFNPHEAFAFAQQTSSLLSKYSVHFLSRILPSLATEAGGERTGTRANAFANVIMGKARDSKQTAEWMRLGLLDPSQVIRNKSGVQGWKAGAVKDTNLALSDPDLFAEKVLIPAMRKGGINVDDPFAVTKELNQLFRNGESNRFATAIVDVLQRQRLHNDDRQIGQAGNVDDIYKRNLAEDPTVAMGALALSLHSLLAVVSLPAMKTAASGISGLASGIMHLADALKDHPMLALGGGSLVAGGALAGAGRMAYSAASGFGLSTSAAALDHAALMLDGAAVRLGTAGGLHAAEGAADRWLAGGTSAAALTAEKSLLSLAASAGTLVFSLVAFEGAMVGLLSWYKSAHPNEFTRNHAPAEKLPSMVLDVNQKLPRKQHFVRAARHGSNGYWVDDDAPPTLASQFEPIGSTASGLPTMATGVSLVPFGKRRRGGGAGAGIKGSSKIDVGVGISIAQPPPIKVMVEVTASSTLLDVSRSAKAASVQLKAQADNHTGPGGLGPTTTGQ